MRNPYQSPAIEQGLRAFANANMLPGTEKLPEFLYIATCNVCPWRSQNPLRINGDPITGNSFIVFAGKRNVSLDKAKKTLFCGKFGSIPTFRSRRKGKKSFCDKSASV